MRAGQKRHIIRIEKPVKVKSSTGSVTTTWELFRNTWASIETLRGYEKQSAVASWPGSDTKIGFTYIAGLLPTMRVVYNGSIYSILNINDVEERRREIQLTCQSGVKPA